MILSKPLNLAEGTGEGPRAEVYVVVTENSAGSATLVPDPNPMNQACVLQRLFKLVATKELLKYRMVNRTWYNMATTTLRKRGAIRNLEHLYFTNTAYSNRPRYNMTTLPRLIDFCYRMSSIPYEAVHVDTAIFTGAHDELVFKEFLEATCLRLKALYFDFSNEVEQQRIFKTDNFPRHLQFPALTELQIRHDSPDAANWEATRSNLEFFGILLNSAPSLKVVILKWQTDGGHALSSLLDSMKSLGTRKLTFLALTCDVNDDHVEQLCALHVKVQKLKLEFCGNSKVTNLDRFLGAQSLHVEHLTIGSRELKEILHVTLPRLERVKTLDIQGNETEQHDGMISMGQIDYERQLPALQELLFQRNAEPEKKAFLGDQIETKGKTVEILRLSETSFTNKYVNRAAELLPNLTKLEIPACVFITFNALVKIPNLSTLAINNSSAFWTEFVNRGRDAEQEIAKEDMQLFQEYHAKQKLGCFRITEYSFEPQEWKNITKGFALKKAQKLVQFHYEGRNWFSHAQRVGVGDCCRWDHV